MLQVNKVTYVALFFFNEKSTDGMYCFLDFGCRFILFKLHRSS